MKRFLALFLCFALCLTLIPAASAEDIEIDDPAGADAPGGPLDEPLIEPVGADAPGGPTDELVIDDPAGADAPGGPLDEIVIDAPGDPLDEIPLVDEPDALALGPDAEIQATLVASGSCGDSLTWEFYDDGDLVIEGSGPMTDYTRGTAPWNQYRSQITGLLIYTGPTTIGTYAFADCSKLKLPAGIGKAFPSSLTSIGQSAFLSCSSLDYVTIPSSVTSIGTQAFDYCSGMKRMTICGSPTLAYRSLGCANLEEISFLGGVPTFDSNIFRNTTATAWYPSDNSAWTSSVLQNYGGTLTWQAGYHGWMGDDITWDLNASTGALSLSGSGTNWDFGSSGRQSWYPIRGKVQSAVVGSGITVLREYAMSYLYNMTSISLPDTLTEIGWEVFLGASKLTSITIPKSVTKLGYRPFRSCSALTEVRFLGHAPSSMATKTFEGVTATVYYFPVYTWTSDTMQQYGGTLTWSCDNKIGTNVSWRLYESGLLDIFGSTGYATDDFPGDYPNFYGFRDEITYSYIYSGCTRAGNYLFYGLDKLEKVIIYGQTELGNHCFGRCTALKEIHFVNNAPTISATAFNNVTATAYYLPMMDGWTSDVLQNYGGSITWVCDNQVGDNVFWALNSSTGALTLTGTGSTWDYSDTDHPGFYYIRSSVKSLTVDEGITTVGEYLFYTMSNLSSVSLPETLTTIETMAFCSCYSLTNLTIPNNVAYINWMAFAYCSGLKTVTFHGTPHFFQSCFYQDTALTDIYFKYHAPDTIPTNTFYGANAKAHYFPVYSWTEDKMTQPSSGSLTWVCDDKIGDDVTWRLEEGGYLYLEGEGPTWSFDTNEPGFYNFRDEVKNARVETGVTELGQYLFWQMNKITQVSFPYGDNYPSLTKIGEYAFYGCTSLTRIKIPASVTEIGNLAFEGCAALKKIDFRGLAPSIGWNAFKGVTATAYYPPVTDGGWTSSVMQNYEGALTWTLDNKVGDDVTWELTCSTGVLTLSGTGSTWDFTNEGVNYAGLFPYITTAVVGEGITRLGYCSLEMLWNLNSVRLPSTLTEIGQMAFHACYDLTELTIPASVTKIDYEAFYGLYIKDFYFLGHAPTFGERAFDGVTATVHYFPVYSWTEDKMQQYGGTLTWVKDDKIGDDVTWYLAENGKLSITGTGETWDFIDGYSPAFCLYFSDEVKTAEIGEGVTGVGDFLFWIMDALEIVVLGPDVETIGAKAFSWCTMLTEIRFQGEAPSFGNNCFYHVTATAWYPMDDPTWTEDVMQDYGGDITWKPYGGYDVTVANYTKGKATTSLVPGLLYSGVITFTVSCDQAVVVAQKTDDGYTLLKCTTEGGVHRYTVIVSADTVIAVAIRGDTNLNGSLEMRDATLVSQVKSGAYSNADGLSTLTADINGNGRVETRDATLICQARNGSYVAPW